ncbi:MAG: DNA starvation/stationary phase protection protein [Ardenticatenaceae bacterium]|nr:DNA starvation/stationary phase protection protein [Anaerolineales bacterium]MCB8985739.1 DNA starvation/stationary phase protection protein [Ardenticatenaceae bacterium]
MTLNTDVKVDVNQELDFVNIGITTDNRQHIVEELNNLLADEHMLYTKTRNFHWNVTGPMFASLHLLFEEQYNSLQETADEIAERVRMLGGEAIGTLTLFLERTRLPESPLDQPNARTMVGRLLEDHESVINQLRQDIDVCTNRLDDVGTADLLTGVMRMHEKIAWMLRAHLQGEAW